MTMRQYLTFLIISLLLFSKITTNHGSNICGKKYLSGYNGTINVKIDVENANVACKWMLSPPKNTITVVRIVEIRIRNPNQLHSSCLKISNHRPICNGNIKNSTAVSVRRYPITIELHSTFALDLQFEYTTRPATECPLNDFQCLDQSKCFNSTDICRNETICKDYSEKRGCGNCNSNSTLCGNDSEECFEMSQRCDGILNCPRGEDELNCVEDCLGIKCPEEEKCINPKQICDDINNCSNGFDETNCVKLGKSNDIILAFLICCICSMLFVCLIYRWMSTRRDLNRILQNLPEFPLAPFQGPGDQDEDTINSSDILDTDIRPGGDIYESYTSNIKKKTVSTKSVQAGNDRFAHLDTENELVVLATLGVPTHLCVGLTVSEETIASLENFRSLKGERVKLIPRDDKLGSCPKPIDKENLEIIHERKCFLRPIRSAPLSSKNDSIKTLISLPTTSEDASLSSQYLAVATRSKKASHSDNFLNGAGHQLYQPHQITIKPYRNLNSDSSQWTDIDEISEGNQYLNRRKPKRKNELKKRTGKIGFPKKHP